MSALVIRDLAGGYIPGEQILKGVDVDADHGQLAVIIGPNGAGKSTAMKLAAGLLCHTRGSIEVEGLDVTNAKPEEVLEAGYVLVPQERNVFTSMTIDENLTMGSYLSPKLTKKRSEQIYERFPLLVERRHALAGTLSGGQRQLLAMGVALMASPKVLALDEPTAGLSPRATMELFAAIRKLADDGMAILMVEQNAIQALAFADRAYVFVDGRVATAGAGKEIAEDPDIRRLFLGGRKLSAG